jgi:HEAT repeat protein
VIKPLAVVILLLGAAEALPGLHPALEDADASVRKQAAWAIGVIGR